MPKQLTWEEADQIIKEGGGVIHELGFGPPRYPEKGIVDLRGKVPVLLLPGENL